MGQQDVKGYRISKTGVNENRPPSLAHSESATVETSSYAVCDAQRLGLVKLRTNAMLKSACLFVRLASVETRADLETTAAR